jgi:hypothetical protein
MFFEWRRTVFHKHSRIFSERKKRNRKTNIEMERPSPGIYGETPKENKATSP